MLLAQLPCLLLALIGWLALTAHAAPTTNNSSLSSFAHNANPWTRDDGLLTPFDPLRLPARCSDSNVYCLSIQTANSAYTEWVHVDLGGWDGIEDTPGQTWRTFVFKGNAAGTIRMSCHPRLGGQDDFHFSFGTPNGWSYSGTQSRNLRGQFSDGKTMSAVSAKAAVATKQAWVDLRIWCRNWEFIKHHADEGAEMV